MDVCLRFFGTKPKNVWPALYSRKTAHYYLVWPSAYATRFYTCFPWSFSVVQSQSWAGSDLLTT